RSPPNDSRARADPTSCPEQITRLRTHSLPILGWIVLMCVAGGVLSALAAAVFALRVSAARVPMLISFAVGALLGAVFLDILPHAFGEAQDVRTMAATVLGGILLFFVLEKF